MSFQGRLKLHLSLSGGGSIYIHEIVGYEGVEIIDKREKRGDKVVRTISYNGNVYQTITQAVEAWKKVNGGNDDTTNNFRDNALNEKCGEQSQK